MSLVNKMLRDLDARRIGDDERAALPTAVTPLAAHREPPPASPWVLVGGAAALAALAATAWWWQASGEPPPAAPAPAIQTAPPAPLPVALAPPPATAAPVSDESAPDKATGAGLRLSDALSVVAPRSAPAREMAPAPITVAPAALPAPRVAAEAAPAPKPATVAEARIEKQLRQPSAAERAEGDYRRGLAAARQGEVETAIAAWRAALDAQPEHGAARQSLAAALIEARRFDEAEDLLRKGSELAPVRLASLLSWARLKVERNQAAAALDILLRHADAGERSAEYQGFIAALLNRAGRPAEAAEHYQAATRLAPAEGRWWAGLGIALDAAGKSSEARDAYLRARALPGLPADLSQHVEQRLR